MVWVLTCEEAEVTDKLLPIASYEDPVQEHNRSSTIALTSTLDACGWVVNATPWPLYARDLESVPILSVRLVGFGSDLEGCGNPQGDSNPGPSSR